MLLATNYTRTDILRRWPALESILLRMQNRLITPQELEVWGMLLQLAESEVERLKSLRPEDGCIPF